MSEWRVVGKGGANVVLCHGDHPHSLLRVPHRDRQHAEKNLLDQFIWGISSYRCPLTRGTPLVEDTGRFISFWSPQAGRGGEAHPIFFTIASLSSGSPEMGHVELSADTTAAIAEMCTASQGVEGMLIANLLHLPGVVAPVSVELKPKCGFLATALSIHPDNRSKWRTSRYQLHQQLKLHQGKIARVSGYDPLDLFSRDLARQMQALESLVSDPQNNLRVWVARASVDKSNLSTWVAAQQPGMTRILQGILNHTEVLKCLLAMQRLDEWDIEGIHPLCDHASFHLQEKGLNISPQKRMCEAPERCQWMMQWCPQSMVPSHKLCEHQEWQDTLDALHRMSWAEVQDALRKYCLAVAAKDCSIIISFTVETGEIGDDVMQTPVIDCHACKNDADKLRNVLEPSKHQAATDKGVMEPVHTCIGSMCIDQQLIWYRVGVVDMDRKSIGKVEHHHGLDREILQAWSRMN